MATPKIVRIVPSRLEGGMDDFHSTTITISGENFQPLATAEVIGDGTIFSTEWLDHESLQCQLDVYGQGGVVLGVVVLNAPLWFSPGTSSNVFPLPLARRSYPTDDDDMIPF